MDLPMRIHRTASNDIDWCCNEMYGSLGRCQHTLPLFAGRTMMRTVPVHCVSTIQTDRTSL